MKTTLSLLLPLSLVCSLTPCTSETPSREAAPSEQATSSPEPPASPPPAVPVSPNAPADSEALQVPTVPLEKGGILIAYFSWSENTQQVAQIIQAETGGNLFEISPSTPYTDNYDELLDIARQEQSNGAQPELTEQVENRDSYNTVSVGYPQLVE